MSNVSIVVKTTGATTASKEIRDIGDSAKNAAPHIESVGKKIDDAGDSSKSATVHIGGLGSALGEVGKIAAGFIVAKGLMELPGLFGGMTGAASDLSESLSKSRAVFGDSSKDIEQFASTAATSLGATKQATAEMAATFGNLFTTMGLTKPAAADMSIGIVKLGTDLASFNNIPVDEALEKLRSGLAGEAEPLRSMGIMLTEAAVKTRAFQLHLQDANGDLSEGAKVQARYSLIMEQSKNAQGDFARTSDGLANSQKILAAQAGDAKEALGEKLLPAQLAVTRALIDAIPQVEEFASALSEKLEGPAGAVADKLGEAVDWLKDHWVEGLVIGTDAATSFMDGVTSAVDGISEGVSGLVSVFSTAMSGVVSVTQSAASLVYEALSYLDPFATHSPSLVSQVQDGVDEIKKQYGSLPASLSALKFSAHELVDIQGDLNSKISDGEDAIDGWKSKVAESTQKISDYKDALSAAKDKLNEFKGAHLAEEAPFDAEAKRIEDERTKLQLAITKLKQQGPLSIEVNKYVTKDHRTSVEKVTEDTEIGVKVKALQDQLDKLGLAADRNNLEKKLAIEPLKDQIESLTDTTKTLKFSDIMRGIKDTQSEIDGLAKSTGDEEKVLADSKASLKLQEDALKDYKAELKEVTDQLGLYNKAIQQIAADQKAAAAEAKKNGGGIPALATPLADAGAAGKSPAKAIEDMQASVDDAKKKFAELRQSASDAKRSAVDMWDSIAEHSKNVAAAIAPATGAVMSFAGTVRGYDWKGAWATVTEGASKVGDFFKGPFNDAIKDGLGTVQKQFEKFKNDIVPGMKTLFGPFLLVMKTELEIVVSAWKENWDKIWPVIEGVFKTIKANIELELKLIRDIFSVAFALLRGDWGGAWDGLKTLLSDWFNGIKTLAKEELGLFKDAAVLALGLFKTAWTTFWDDVKGFAITAFENMVSGIGDLAGSAWDAAKKVGDKLLDGLKSALSATGGLASDVGGAVLGAIKSVVNDQVIDRINSALEFSFDSHIPGIGEISIDPPDIGHLANGTSDWRGGLTVVGERGPELVNLPRGSQVFSNQQSRRMTGDTNITIGTVIATDEAQARRFAGDLSYLMLTARGVA